MDGNITKNENGDLAYVSSKDLCIDFFVKIVRGSSVSTIVSAWSLAYEENPKIALKVLYNFRDIRGGKGERLISFVVLFWLKCWDPDVYRNIIEDIVKTYGCWKDILFICDMTTKYEENAHVSLDNELELDIIVRELRKDLDDDHPSLLVKWIPMENKRYHSIYLELLKKLGMTPRQYRRSIVGIRKKLNLVETNMSNGMEDSIKFEGIPSACHRIHRKAFAREKNAKKVFLEQRLKLKERYEKYLENLDAGKAKINFKGTQPHQIVSQYMNGESKNSVLEGQWKSIIQDIKKSGTFEKSLAVVDVSGSMDGQPMEVAIALGILTSECTQPPFNEFVLTFSDKPKFLRIGSGRLSLYDRVRIVKNMDWGYNTNLDAVFKLILAVALEKQTPPEKMIERLFIFTDMQFDSANRDSHWETTFERLKCLFSNKGYKLPQIICWNLRSSDSVPTTVKYPGVCMMSGFSGELLKAVMKAEGDLDSSMMFNIVVDPYDPKWEPHKANGFEPDTNILAEVIKSCAIKKK